ncbi:MAG: WD40 repeat domain-containing protein, partial [Verrucomicrobiales bacterium]|nr:WD40 repeat domain-containing protein [Verrucomicrobiales bacterium]
WGAGGAWVSDSETGALLNTLDGHRSAVNEAAFSGDGQRVVTCSSDESAILWSLETNSPVRKLLGHDGWVWKVSFSPDSQRIATGARDRQRRGAGLWHGVSGEQIAMPEDQGKWVRSVVFAPDGALFASGSNDFTIRLWNSETGALVVPLRGHDNVVETLDFSPDSLRLASGGADRTVRLWDVKTHRPLAVFRGHAAGVVSVRYSPNGHWIASIDQHGRVLLFPGSLAALLGLAFQALRGRPRFDQVRSLFEDLRDSRTFPGEVFGRIPDAAARLKEAV